MHTPKIRIPKKMYVLCVLLGSFGAAGCFNPRFQEGASCSESRTCPPGMDCFNGRCCSPSSADWCPAPAVDAGVPEVVVDAAPLPPTVDASPEEPVIDSGVPEVPLEVPDVLTDDFFGRSVAVAGNLAVIGRLNAVDVFRDLNGDGQFDFVDEFEAKLTSSNDGPGDHFGTAVATDGTRIVVGAFGEDSGDANDPTDNSAVNAGSAYVFVYDGVAWKEDAYLKADNINAGDLFGFSVAIDGDRVAVGALYEDSNNSDVVNNEIVDAGAVYVFAHDGTAWLPEARLGASNADQRDCFGSSVAIHSNRIVVGAYGEDSSGPEQSDNAAGGSGAAYVYAFVDGKWTQESYLKPDNALVGERFGSSIDIDQDHVVVGAPRANIDGRNDSGAAYVFARQNNSWEQDALITASNSDAGDYFGTSVAINMPRIIVGATGEDSANMEPLDNSAADAGAAYVFADNGTQWVEVDYLKTLKSDLGSYGFSVDIHSNRGMVSARMINSITGGTVIMSYLDPQP